jgi:hypothetical protein
VRFLPVLALLLLAACGAPTAPAAETTTSDTAAAMGPWETHIADMLPAIDACIASAPENRTITYAAPFQGGVLVRLDGELGKLDCRVDADGAHARVSMSDPALMLEGDGEAIFVHGPGENPGGECYEAPEVHGPDGALLGWMLDSEGC